MGENERLKEVRKYTGLTLQKFGARIGLSAGAVSDMERGRRGLTDQTIISICREFRINEEWLRNGGDVEMTKPDASDELEALVKKYNLSFGAQVFIEKFVNSPSEAQNAVIDLIVETAAAIKGDDIDYRARPQAPSFDELPREEQMEEFERMLDEEKEAGGKYGT